MTAYVVAGIIVAACLLLALYLRSYVRLRGTRVVTCPETKQTAAVEIDTRAAAASALLGRPRFHLDACSHWPERHGCGQACVRQIESAPADCLVRTQLTRWYEGKACALCHRAIGPVDWYDRRPTLITPDRQPLMWQEIDAVNLEPTLRTHQPLCFDCYVAETFRRTHPELVLDNPWRNVEG